MISEFEYSSIIWLTQNKYTIVDNEDYGWLSQWKWHSFNDGLYKVYARRTVYPEKIGLRMHRILISVPDGSVTDHINGNGLDNRKGNLRICTQALNNRNTHIVRGKVPFKGVWLKQGGYEAYIKVSNKRVYIGRSKDPEELARKYDEFALRLHGEFACTNRSLGLISETGGKRKNESGRYADVMEIV